MGGYPHPLRPAARSWPTPRQVHRVDRQAVASDTRARVEAHEPERLGRCRLQRCGQIRTGIAGHFRRLVDQHDVHGREGVLQQLRELRLLAPATGTTRCTSPEQKAAARSSDAASIPLTIFGVVVSVHIRLPGSIRSGLNPEANP